MPDEVKTFSGSLVLDLIIWWRHVHTLYSQFHMFLLIEKQNCYRVTFSAAFSASTENGNKTNSVLNQAHTKCSSKLSQIYVDYNFCKRTYSVSETLQLRQQVSKFFIYLGVYR